MHKNNVTCKECQKKTRKSRKYDLVRLVYLRCYVETSPAEHISVRLGLAWYISVLDEKNIAVLDNFIDDISSEIILK